MTLTVIGLRLGPRAITAVAAALVSLAVVSAVIVAYPRASPGPSMGGVDGLLRMGRFDEAERKIATFLEAHPLDDRANLLMAQVALGRGDQKPSMALEHLARVRATAPRMRALVHLNQGKAYSSMGRHEQAESSWLDALRADRMVPEAGWALLGIYYVEDRRADARRLGLALHAIEPDPRDCVQFLMELLRQDAKPIVPFSVIRVFRPVVRDHPEERHAAIALARALIRDDQSDEAMPILDRLVANAPEDPKAWEALLGGLDEASRVEAIPGVLARVPASIAGDARFARFRGIVARDQRDWPTAVEEYRRARRSDPGDAQVAYRLSQALKLAGLEDEAAQADEEFRTLNAAALEALTLYNEANGVPNLGIAPSVTLYRKIAALRERMGRRAEALAWHRLILRDRPDDHESLADVFRLADAAMPSLDAILDGPLKPNP